MLGPRAMTCACARFVFILCATLAYAEDAEKGVLYNISDEQYYSMPRLFHLDDYEACLASRGVYCLGSFELTPLVDHHELYWLMQRYSANWVDHFNHTRLHRGLCVSKRCPMLHNDTVSGSEVMPEDTSHFALDSWFSTCVNSSTMSSYNLSARLFRLDYCRRGPRADKARLPLNGNERAFASFVATLLALAAVSTILDWMLTDHTKKNARWALAWSVPGCWGALMRSPPVSARTDLAAFDGLRVICMLCVIIEHVVWLSTLAYVGAPRYTEMTRREGDVMLMTNSTLVVQIFFLMSSFLLAHKLLQQRRLNKSVAPIRTFFSTLVQRIIRVSPSYFVVVWFAASWWERAGRGPLWTPMVEAEAAVCRRKWWTHLLYLNNIIYADDKCLIQTWYLAADMQLYAASLALTLALWRLRTAAVYVLTAMLTASIALLFCLAYSWSLVPTFVMHRPELIRAGYDGESSFNVLYQSPIGNVPGALAGLLLAHLHHAFLDSGVQLSQYKWFCRLSVMSTPICVWWAATSPWLLGGGLPSRGAAAALAALERPVFVFFTMLALLGAMHNIKSPWQRWMTWTGWATPARLSFGALLLHMPINKTLVASRIAPTQLDRQTAIIEWFGIASVSYMVAFPLALLVELPAQRLHSALTAPSVPSPTTPSKPASAQLKSDS